MGTRSGHDIKLHLYLQSQYEILIFHLKSKLSQSNEIH